MDERYYGAQDASNTAATDPAYAKSQMGSNLGLAGSALRAEPRATEAALNTIESISSTLEQALKSLCMTGDRLFSDANGLAAASERQAQSVRDARSGVTGHMLDRLDSMAQLATVVLAAAARLEQRI